MVFRRIETETFLVPIKSNAADLDNIYILNEIAARIWELIDGTHSTEDIKNTILEEYDVTPEQADADIKEFIAALEGIRALRSLNPLAG